MNASRIDPATPNASYARDGNAPSAGAEGCGGETFWIGRGAGADRFRGSGQTGPGNGGLVAAGQDWAIEIRRSLSPRPGRGMRSGVEDLERDRGQRLADRLAVVGAAGIREPDRDDGFLLRAVRQARWRVVFKIS